MNFSPNTLITLLDAASAGIAAVSPQPSSTTVVATADASNSKSFVLYDDVVLDSVGGVLSHAAATMGFYKDSKNDIVMEDEEKVVELFASGESIMSSPHLIFLGEDIERCCLALLPDLAKWCYNTQ